MTLNLGTVTTKSYFYQVPEDATAQSLNADFWEQFGDFYGYDESYNFAVADRFAGDEGGNIWAHDEMDFGYTKPIVRGSYLLLTTGGNGFSTGNLTEEQINFYFYVLESPA